MYYIVIDLGTRKYYYTKYKSYEVIKRYKNSDSKFKLDEIPQTIKDAKKMIAKSKKSKFSPFWYMDYTTKRIFRRTIKIYSVKETKMRNYVK